LKRNSSVLNTLTWKSFTLATKNRVREIFRHKLKMNFRCVQIPKFAITGFVTKGKQ